MAKRKRKHTRIYRQPRRPGENKSYRKQVNVRLPDWLRYLMYQSWRRYSKQHATVSWRIRYLLERDARIVLGLPIPDRLRQGLPPEDDPLTDYQI